MARAPWASDRIYVVAQRWVDECLAADGSLFAPGAAIWTADVIDAAAERLLVIDTSKRAFFIKLDDQLAGSSNEVVQFVAELLYVYLLPITNISAATKQANVERVLAGASSAPGLPPELVAVLGGGVANYGAGLARQDHYVRFFARWVRSWKHMAPSRRAEALADPWAFRDVLGEISGPRLMQREAILHLVHPDVFEYALAPSDKDSIAKAFARRPSVAAAANVDRKLLVIREEVEGAIGRSLNLYAPWFRTFWKAEGAAWPDVVRWATRMHSSPGFNADERDYKLTVAQHMAAARAALLGGDHDWADRLRAAFGPPNNLTHWQWEHGPFLRWCDDDPDSVRDFLKRAWGLSLPEGPAVEEVLGHLPEHVLSAPAARLSLLSVLLMGIDPARFPPYRAGVVSSFRALVGAGDVEGPDGHAAPAGGLGGEYAAFIDLLDALRVRLMAVEVELRDRLDAQGLVWWLVKGEPRPEWSEDVTKAFQRFQHAADVPVDPPAEVAVPERAWLVRGANVDGENLVPRWLEEGFVSIGWRDVGEIEAGASIAAIYALVKEAYPEGGPNAWGAATGNLFRFLVRIEPGDLLLTVDGDRLYVGRAEGGPYTDTSGPPNALRRRRVEWLNAAEPASRRQVREDHRGLYARLRTLLTVTDLGAEVASVASLAGIGAERTPAVELSLPPADDELAAPLHLPREWLQREVIDLLREKRQLVFYGPPGTGKTYVARGIAEHLTRDGGDWELVQFHPSYSYEDFFEGFRPVAADGGVGVAYELTPGPLRRIADVAAADPFHPYVLVIDEINRGNVPKIFGELLFLLEYRDERIPLLYSPDAKFGLPENLFVIATMNTADRSIALVDAALRRRFYFVRFAPGEEPIRGVLARWLAKHKLDDEPARLLEVLNAGIGADEFAIGPSYFMTADGNAPDLERVWAHAILPLLEEHYYGTERKVGQDFGLDALRAAIGPPALEDQAAAPEPDKGDEGPSD